MREEGGMKGQRYYLYGVKLLDSFDGFIYKLFSNATAVKFFFNGQ